jgi:hypothetical protein
MNTTVRLENLPKQIDLSDITKVLQFSATEATGQPIYKGNELLPGWERLNYNVRGNSLVYWVSPTNVSVEYMKDVDDVRENLSIRSDSMLHFIFTYYTTNDATWAVFAQRLLTKHIVDYIKLHLGESVVKVDGNDVYIVDAGEKRKFSVSIAGIAPGLVKFHFGVNVESKGAPIPVSSLSDLMKLYDDMYSQPDDLLNPFLPMNFVINVIRNFVIELEDIIDDSQKCVF